MPGVRLGVEERETIALGLARGEPFAQIARRMGRPTSTIAREVNRAGGRAGYCGRAAQRRANEAAKRPKVLKLVASPALAGLVAAGLQQRWSSGEVAARLILDYPNDEEMRVSHETIYQSLYLQGRGGLKRELICALRTGRLRRRPRRRGEAARRPNVLGEIEPISARPPEAADRAIPGHWEGDLIMGAFNRSAIVTVVERRSRFLLLGELPDGHGAQAVYECLLGLCGDLPDVARRSLTWDQGTEMADWVDLEIDADIEVYFCDPRSPWQRPSNEHMNGLLRQYFPKGTDLNNVSRAQLQAVAIEMNGRPRKVLGWRTPAEVYADVVATTP
jgi:IS30 family transposase